VKLWAGLALAWLAGSAHALELALPDGAMQAHDASVPAARYALPTGPAKAGTVPLRQVEGTLRHRVWHLSPPQTLAVLLASLRAQLEEAGYEVLLDCTARGCGGYDFRFAVEDVGPPQMMVDLGRYGYLSARNSGTGHYAVILVSETRSLGYVQLTEITPAEIALDLDTTPDAQVPGAALARSGDIARPLADLLLSQGRVVLEDLRFATGNATLENGQYPSLTALAGFLTENPDLVIALVGHTDAEGSIDANLALSMRRAEAVRDRLVADYGVASERLRAEGVGYLAPRATNRTEEGRRANRRVEAVLTQP
jgi:OOP family OmpA-OmpF porin